MIHSLEDKNRKELVEIVKIQIEDYQALTKRVADLEKENVKNLGWIAQAMMRGLTDISCGDELIKIAELNNLEQQAKGVVKGYVSACKWALGSQYDECVAKNRALIYAKQLKEQG